MTSSAIERLDRDSMCVVFRFLNTRDKLCSVSVVSHAWCDVLHDSECWRVVQVHAGTPTEYFYRWRTVRRMKVASASAATLLAVGQHCRQLRELDFTTCFSVCDASLEAAAAVASSSPHLRRLSLHGCKQVSDMGVRSVARSHCGLRSLDLSRCGRVSDDGLMHIATGLSQLEDLRLDHCKRITDAGLLHLASLKCLRALSLDNCRVTDTGIFGVVGECKRIAYLSMAACTGVTDTSFRQIATLNRVHSVDASLCTLVTSAGVCALLKSAHATLVHLNLSGCRALTDDALRHVGEMVHLRMLKVSGCVLLTDTGIGYASGCAALQCLEMDFASAAVTDVGVFRVLRKCTRLEKLSMCQCSGVRLDGAGDTYLNDDDADNSGALMLTDVNLSYSSITAAGLHQLLRRSPQLRSVVLRHCNDAVDDSTLLTMASHCAEVERVNLSYCGRVTHVGLEQLVRWCTRLEALELLQCAGVTDRAVCAMAHYAKCLRTLCVVDCVRLTPNSLLHLANNANQLSHLIVGGTVLTTAQMAWLKENATTPKPHGITTIT